MIVNTILVQEGQLEVSKRWDIDSGAILGFFWIDAKIAPKHLLGVGPFPHLSDAIEHYAIAAQQYKEAMRNVIPITTNVHIDNVIEVDFLNKRRVRGA